MPKNVNTMKKLVLLIAVLICSISCSHDDAVDTTFTYELVPVTTVEIPDTLIFQNTYIFDITYLRPTECYFFEGFSYEQDQNERVIGVISEVFDNPDCQSIDSLTAVANMNFVVKRNDFYTFRFWQGENENGEAIFLTKEVPVRIQ